MSYNISEMAQASVNVTINVNIKIYVIYLTVSFQAILSDPLTRVSRSFQRLSCQLISWLVQNIQN